MPVPPQTHRAAAGTSSSEFNGPDSDNSAELDQHMVDSDELDQSVVDTADQAAGGPGHPHGNPASEAAAHADIWAREAAAQHRYLDISPDNAEEEDEENEWTRNQRSGEAQRRAVTAADAANARHWQDLQLSAEVLRAGVTPDEATPNASRPSPEPLACGFVPGPYFDPAVDGIDPRGDPESKAAWQASYFSEKAAHHARMQKAVVDLGRVCDHCNEAWVDTGCTPTLVGWMCRECKTAHDQRGRKRAEWDIPKRLQMSDIGEDLANLVLSRGEQQLIQVIFPAVSWCQLTTRSGANIVPTARRYKKRTIFVTRALEEYLSVEVPASIETMMSFVLRVEGLSDDQCRRNAGFTVRRAVVHRILLWLMENNVVWSQWREDGRLSWNAERFEAVTDGLLDVPVVGTAEAGLTMLRGSGPADDAENCDDDALAEQLTQEEVVEVVASVTNPTVKASLLHVVSGPAAEGFSASLRNPGLEALAWYGTSRPNFHHFDRFELDLRRHVHVRGAAFSCLRLKLADIVLI